MPRGPAAFGIVRPVRGLGHIFRWDLDKTYLQAEFDTIGDIVRTARIPPEDRKNIPGAAALVRAIADEATEAQPHEVYFLSGSPEQLRGVIDKKFELDGIAPSDLVLKPTVSNILRGHFRSVLGQVAYKLQALLLARAAAPVGSVETLFGDDSESDAFIYSLYADVVSGEVGPKLLAEVLERAGAYDSQIRAILAAREQVIREAPVRRILIHHDSDTRPAVSSGFFPRLVPIYNHLQSAIVLALDGSLPARAVHRVAEELLRRYDFELEGLLRLAEDILRRQRSQLDDAAYRRLAAALPKPSGDPEVDDLCEAIGAKLADLLSRPAPAAKPVPPRDYLALWHEDRARHDAARKARREA